MNAAKTEAMVSTPVVKATKIREGAYRRKLRGTGPEYVDRSRMPMQCPIAGCNSVLQKRSLASHMRNQHPGVLPQGLSLRTVSLVRPMRQGYTADLSEGKFVCPVTDCGYECASSTQPRRHFLYRHPEDHLQVIGEEPYVKRPDCGKMVKT